MFGLGPQPLSKSTKDSTKETSMFGSIAPASSTPYFHAEYAEVIELESPITKEITLSSQIK